MYSCGVNIFLTFLIAGIYDQSIFTDGASVNQNYGGGFNPKPSSGQPAYPVIGNAPYVPQIASDRLNIFDTELLKHAAKQNAGNFMVSPASIKAALAILLEGARGTCAEELKRTLKLPNDQEQVRQHFNAFMASLNTYSDGILLESANKIFLSQKYIPDNNYVQVLKNTYYSELRQENFADPDTPRRINKLINDSTHGLIPEVLSAGDVAPDTILILTNVLYFKGLWENAFNQRITHAKCFNVDGNCRNVAMMEVQGDYKYGHIDELHSQAIDIPYKGGKYSMLVLLPDDVNGLSTLLTELPYFSLPKILEQMEESEVELSLPRFTIDYSQDLTSILQQLGIQEVFNSNADLFGIVAKGIKSPQVSSVFHKTHIEVNEQGSVAAAVTGAMVIPLMGSSAAIMRVNHPFLFFIRDVTTGTVLFQGRVNYPDEVYVPPPRPSANPSYQSSTGSNQNQAGSNRQPTGNVNYPSQSSSSRQPASNVNYPSQSTSSRQPASNINYQSQISPSRQPIQPISSVQLPSSVQQIHRRKEPVRTVPPTVQPVYNNDYDIRTQSIPQEQPVYINLDQQQNTRRTQNIQPIINYQQQTGKQQGTNIPLSPSFSPQNSNPTLLHEIPPNSNQILNQPSYNDYQSSANSNKDTNSYYGSSVHDGNRNRDNVVSNNGFDLQRGIPDNIEPVKTYTIQTQPNRMELIYQVQLSKDKDAITFIS